MSSAPTTVMLTKEQLKNALVQGGFPIPPASARKEEFQRLYDEKVLPHQTRSEFSSDDEQESTSNGGDTSTQEQAKVVSVDDIQAMTDQELYNALQELGAVTGPVVESTRALYEHQLLALLTKKTPTKLPLADSNGHHVDAKESTNGNGYSDSDDEMAVETASRASRSSRGSGSTTSPKKRGRTVVTPKPETVTYAEVAPVTPSRPRVQRRSETPKSQAQRPEAFNSVESRVSERARNIDTRGSFPSSEGGMSSGVSYFKERPGYASTTTSNVLPRKPTASPVYNDEFGSQKKARSEVKETIHTRSTLKYAITAALIAVSIALCIYFLKLSMDTEGPVKDELDQLLDNMENLDGN